MIITSKNIADELKKQHSNVKGVIEKLNKERHILFLEKLRATPYGKINHKLPRWCYVLSPKQALFLKCYLDHNRLGNYILRQDI